MRLLARRDLPCQQVVELVTGYLEGSLSGLRRRRTLRAADIRRTLRAADKRLAAACALVTLSAVVLLAGSDALEFSWRYQLPAVILLPLAGALGFTAVAARITAARNRAAGNRAAGKSEAPVRPTAGRTATGGTGRRTHPAAAGSGLRAPGAR